MDAIPLFELNYRVHNRLNIPLIGYAEPLLQLTAVLAVETMQVVDVGRVSPTFGLTGAVVALQLFPIAVVEVIEGLRRTIAGGQVEFATIALKDSDYTDSHSEGHPR